MSNQEDIASQDPQTDQCGSRDEAAVGATAALAQVRERYARIIDPMAFKGVEQTLAFHRKYPEDDVWFVFSCASNSLAEVQRAYQKADAILAEQAELIAQRAALVDLVQDFRIVNAKAAMLGYGEPETWGDEMFALQARAYTAVKALTTIKTTGGA